MNINTNRNRQKVFPSIEKWIRIQFLHQTSEKLKILEVHGSYQQDVWFYRWFYKRDENYGIKLSILPIDYVFSNCVVSSSVIIGSIFFSCQHLFFGKTQNIQVSYTEQSELTHLTWTMWHGSCDIMSWHDFILTPTWVKKIFVRSSSYLINNSFFQINKNCSWNKSPLSSFRKECDVRIILLMAINWHK